MILRLKTPFWYVIIGVVLLGLVAGLLWVAAPNHRGAENTSVSTTKPTVVVAAGDIACELGDVKTTFTCRGDDTATLVKSLRPDAVLTLGDNQYPKGALDSYQASYDKTWGAFKNITYPVPGNHEYYTPDASGYFDYFGSRAGERGKGYYTFTVGSWRFIALNSEIDVSADSPQLTWLRQELQKDENACTVAYWHQPRFTTGEHASNQSYDAIWRTLYSGGVDIVLNGHAHDYERFIPQNPDAQYDPAKGITEFVAGMGGQRSEPFGGPLPTLATRQNHAFGVLKLTLYAKGARYAFVPIPAQQTFSDSGTIACH